MEYFILGRHKNKLVVDVYVTRIIKSLKLHRLSKRSIIIDFKTSLDDEALGLCFGGVWRLLGVRVVQGLVFGD